MSRKRVSSAFGASGVVAFAFLSLGQGRPMHSHGPQFGDPLPNLTSDELARFRAGQAVFQVVDGVVNGLGPVFNDNSCVACHSVGGTGGGSTRLETRFGRFINGEFDPMTDFGGSLIQEKGIGLLNGVNFVGEIVPSQATVMALRRTTPLFGLGLVDNVPDSLLLQIAEQEQVQTPATAGRANIVLDSASGQQRVGRFGWKCQQATLLTFSGDAYLNEMGITTPMFPIEICPQGNCALLTTGLPAARDEPDNDDVMAFTDFMTFLAPPPNGPNTVQMRQGANLFAKVGCVNCHLPTLQTGNTRSAACNQVTFSPFSDFLLHDMGRLGDGIAQNGAGTHEMRTAPLWGVRLFTTFLHDGRTTNLADAILAHDGQGRDARNRFAALNRDQRSQLIAFLSSL
jgi:CxxC motif-containing protein (DUF1111 family)